mgnify:FL=1
MKIKNYDVEMSGYRPKLVVKETYDYEGKVAELNQPEKIARFCRNTLNLHKKLEEHMYMIGFTTKFNVVGVSEIGMGGRSYCHVDKKNIMTRLLLMGATCVALVHNHPSKNPNPSKDDLDTTAKIKKSCESMDIHLIDHIIIGGFRYYSFSEHDKL